MLKQNEQGNRKIYVSDVEFLNILTCQHACSVTVPDYLASAMQVYIFSNNSLCENYIVLPTGTSLYVIIIFKVEYVFT